MKASDLMVREVVTIHDEATVDELCDLLQEKNINGVPVVDHNGSLVGVVTMEDIIYGAMGITGEDKRKKEKKLALYRGKLIVRQPEEKAIVMVKEIMTSPAIFAYEDTPLIEICRTMWNFRIHRIPIVHGDRVTGVISSLDLCRAIATGTITA
ncbi:MAG: CBS domain-containing protein [Acidobacteriota bacterium]